MSTRRRNPIPLDVVVRYQNRVIERLHINVDPDVSDSIEVRQVLVDAMYRKHRSPEHKIGDYALDAWRTGKDLDSRRPWRTFAFTAVKR